MKFVFVALFITFGSHLSESHRILGVFPHPAVSHFRAFQPLLLGLAGEGHDVHVVSHFPDNNAPSNYHDLALNKNEVITAAFSVEEVRTLTLLLSFMASFSSLFM